MSTLLKFMTSNLESEVIVIDRDGFGPMVLLLLSTWADEGPTSISIYTSAEELRELSKRFDEAADRVEEITRTVSKV